MSLYKKSSFFNTHWHEWKFSFILCSYFVVFLWEVVKMSSDISSRTHFQFKSPYLIDAVGKWYSCTVLSCYGVILVKHCCFVM